MEFYSFLCPENRGLLKSFAGEKTVNRTGERMDEFTTEFMFKNTGYEIVSKGTWDKIEFLDKEKRT